METDNFMDELTLRFDICCMASEEIKIEEDLSLLSHVSMYHISA